MQLFGLIVMASAAAIIDMARNGLLDRPTKNKEISYKKTSMFNDSPEELHITSIMCVVQEATTTRQLSTDAMDRQHNAKQERDNMVKREVLKKAKDEFIQFIIYRHVWDSDRRGKTSGEVKNEVRYMKLKKEKESGLKGNLQMY